MTTQAICKLHEEPVTRLVKLECTPEEPHKVSKPYNGRKLSVLEYDRFVVHV